MISFTILTAENAEELFERGRNTIPDLDSDYLEDIFSTLSEYDSEVALCFSDGCLLVRIFDGEYSFVFPIHLCEDADSEDALNNLRLYAIKEEVPLVLSDVPFEELGWVIPGFRHVTADAADRDGECYNLRVSTEAALLDEIPTLEFSGLTLDSLTEGDDALFARLCKDRETNKFWGYDYSLDVSDPEDSYFRIESEREFARGAAISFAVRQEGDFIGEATLYGFDYLGGCEVAIRVLPQYRRLGVAGKILDGLFDNAASLGLVSLSAQVMKDNIPSVGLCKKHFEEYSQINEKTYKFTQKI